MIPFIEKRDMKNGALKIRNLESGMGNGQWQETRELSAFCCEPVRGSLARKVVALRTIFRQAWPSVGVVGAFRPSSAAVHALSRPSRKSICGCHPVARTSLLLSNTFWGTSNFRGGNTLSLISRPALLASGASELRASKVGLPVPVPMVEQ